MADLSAYQAFLLTQTDLPPTRLHERTLRAGLGWHLVEAGWAYSQVRPALVAELALKSDALFRDFMGPQAWARAVKRLGQEATGELALALLAVFEAEEARWVSAQLATVSEDVRWDGSRADFQQSWYYLTENARRRAWKKVVELHRAEPSTPAEWLASLTGFATPEPDPIFTES